MQHLLIESDSSIHNTSRLVTVTVSHAIFLMQNVYHIIVFKSSPTAVNNSIFQLRNYVTVKKGQTLVVMLFSCGKRLFIPIIPDETSLTKHCRRTSMFTSENPVLIVQLDLVPMVSLFCDSLLHRLSLQSLTKSQSIAAFKVAQNTATNHYNLSSWMV